MNPDIDEEKLTAYALGELDPDEQAAVTQRIANDEAARRYVAEVRDTADLLAGELRAERSPGLTDSQRAALEEKIGGGAAAVAVPIGAARPRGTFSRPLAIAASVLLVVGVVGVMVQTLGRTYKPYADALNDSAYARKVESAKSPGSVVTNRLASPATPAPDAEALIQDAGEMAGAGAAHDTIFRSAAGDAQVGDVGKSTATLMPVVITGPVQKRPGDDVQRAEMATAPGKLSATEVKKLEESLRTKGHRDAAERLMEYRIATQKERQSPGELNGKRDPSKGPQPPKPDAPAKDGLARFVEGVDYADRVAEPAAPIVENEFQGAAKSPLSTFSIDVDTAAYANIRTHLNRNMIPPADVLRIEEMVNYFPYSYTPPSDGLPFSAAVEVAQCPWAPEHRLARVGIKGREIAEDKRPPSNLVFLIDVSGSMDGPNRLPLVQSSLKLLANRLHENDRVAMVVYAGSSGLVLPSTSCMDKATVLGAIDRLRAGGSTNGAQGIQLAYKVAEENFIKNGTNRVILCTDGDFNVGITDRGALTKLIEEKRKSGVFLSVLGFGMGNYKDGTLETLADKGNGNYGYIDDEKEARKLFVEQMSGTLVAIAKDVKIQIEFNPAKVASYRLIGYENRILAHEDFNNDAKDAGDIGAGHTVTALYELVLAGSGAAAASETPGVDPLEYQSGTALTSEAYSGELFKLKLRFKQPDGETSALLKFPATDSGNRYSKASADFKFAAAVASFGMLLRNSAHKGNASFDAILELAEESKGDDPSGYRAEFIGLVQKAKALLKK